MSSVSWRCRNTTIQGEMLIKLNQTSRNNIGASRTGPERNMEYGIDCGD
jgi:hypothetical protein